MSADQRRIESALRAHDKGRSWSQIADLLDVAVVEARAIVSGELERRRHFLARTPLSEGARGLLDDCRHCHHPRKDHRGEEPCSTCGSVRTVYDVVDHRVEPALCTTVEQRPDRPVGTSYLQWYFHAREVGCRGFESVQEHRDALAARGPRTGRGRWPNDLRSEAYDLGVLNDSGWQAVAGRAFQSGAGGPSMRSLVRRARRKVARQAGR